MKTEFIIGLDAKYTNDALFEVRNTTKWGDAFDPEKDIKTVKAMGLEQGFNRYQPDDYENWLKDAVPNLVIRQREGLEIDVTVRQILPYTVIARVPSQMTLEATSVEYLMQNLDKMEIFTYQRGKGIGEARLAGNWSIGVGGHIDLADITCTTSSSDIDLKALIKFSMFRELNEELYFNVLTIGQGIVSRSYGDLLEANQVCVAHYGFIRDDNDAVGRVHLGLVNIVFIGNVITPMCLEEELTTGEMKPAATLIAEGLNFEGWSKIVLEELAQIGQIVSSEKFKIEGLCPEITADQDEARDERFALKP